jgi:hypothetical protein
MAIMPSGYHAPITAGQLGTVAASFLFAGIGFGRLFSGAAGSEGRFAANAAIVILLLLVAAFAYRKASRAIPAPNRFHGADPADVAHFAARQAERERTIGHP